MLETTSQIDHQKMIENMKSYENTNTKKKEQ